RQNVFRSSHSERPELQASYVENVERDDVAAADLAEHVLDRHANVVEVDGASRAALDAHLFFFGAGSHTRPSAFHEESGELFATHFGEHGEQIRGAAVCDPHLLAVE